MAEQSRTILKQYFETGKKPTQQEYENLIDSHIHKTEDKASTAEAQAGSNDLKFVTPLKAKQAVQSFATSSVAVSSTTLQGKVELATLAEVETGTDTARAVTPQGAKRAAEFHAPVKSVNGQTGNVTITVDTDSGWQTPSLLSGIVDYNPASFQVARYRKKNGVVYVEGLVKGGTATGEVNIFVLPVGYRPNKTLILHTQTASGIFRLDVLSSGAVRCFNYNAAWTSISGISFLAD